MSCLHYQMATYGGNDRILSLLLENSANPNIQVRITINKLLHSTLFCLVGIHILIWLVVHFVHGTVSTHHVPVGLQWNESSSFSSHGRPYQLFDSSLGFPCPHQLHGLLWGKVCLFIYLYNHSLISSLASYPGRVGGEKRGLGMRVPLRGSSLWAYIEKWHVVLQFSWQLVLGLHTYQTIYRHMLYSDSWLVCRYTPVDYARLHNQNVCADILANAGGVTTQTIKEMAAVSIQATYRGYRCVGTQEHS